MRNLILIISLFAFACTKNSSNEATMSTTPVEVEKPMLRHVVLFKFKDGTAESDIQKVETAFADLPNHIAEIKGLEWGTNNSPEGLDQGFTHCFFLSFADEEGRATYLPHPKHKEFGEILTPYLDKVLVVDYWTN